MAFPSAQTNSTTPIATTRVVVRLRGTVQGVGFRPFVHRLAIRLGARGEVRNVGDGVLVELEGEPGVIEQFLAALSREAPRAARIESMEVHAEQPQGVKGFRIAGSRTHDEAMPGNGKVLAFARVAAVPPDLATCSDCWREFHNPADRRYRYPFLNCTQCGPRFTIVIGVPYDRALTTMRRFTMCVACQREYDDPTHRRFHAEPNACADCGPQVAWSVVRRADTDMREPALPVVHATDARNENALRAALTVLRAGGIVAAKGIGGYHLLCDARNADAVARLRLRKDRPHKPLAVLVDTLSTLRTFADVRASAVVSLESPAHPIVLVPTSKGAAQPLAHNVAPGLDSVGVMLPAFPLHALLAADGPLVCTSGNLSDEPIAWRDVDALRRLAVLADGFLTHNREIVLPCDDSVVSIGDDGHEQPVRRSRGYAPYPIPVAASLPASIRASASVLAVGAELKSTAAWLAADQVTLSSHIGDVGSPETLEALTLATGQLEAMHHGRADVIACDLHPEYHSSRWAAERARQSGATLVRVQHHHAHLAALMAEHGLPGSTPILACTFDGTGWGTDGTVWGGEMLLGDCTGFTRVASLTPFPLAGGDAAVRQPLRGALGLLHRHGHDVSDNAIAPMLHHTELTSEARRLMIQQLERGIACVETSSMGRFLDACAVLCGGPAKVSYEGQAAILLEVLARQYPGTRMRAGYNIDVHEGPASSVNRDGVHAPRWLMNPAPMLQALLWDMQAEVSASRSLNRTQDAWADAIAPIAWHVHDAVARVVVDIALRVRRDHGTNHIGLTGGVFQNQLLSTLTARALETDGFEVLQHRRVPCNDGGLALGQALIAAHATQKMSPTSSTSRLTHHLAR
ncbi:hydrogenase maturation protein HypF [Gemmatimonas aurantiaca T-27]|uniref:acylphosphatase n=2 Tax=Gemmatimonas aurantiaca TaxID=173480 RepID=C1A5F1_GEMAT|nr:carbamoyltransferase HypF [Gemmatimonas aurantiaca]BAH37461.1 hydrogenase maturation protein HypF [Gemmatimonas aurantiaca T-27]